jgi:hypothetical protein
MPKSSILLIIGGGSTKRGRMRRQTLGEGKKEKKEEEGRGQKDIKKSTAEVRQFWRHPGGIIPSPSFLLPFLHICHLRWHHPGNSFTPRGLTIPYLLPVSQLPNPK